MVKIGDVWDSTTDALAGRARLLIPVAAAAFFVPFVIRAAIEAYGGASAGAAVLGAVVALLSLPLLLWGLMTVIAVASDPATTREEAGRLALGRVPAALLVALILAAVVLVVFLPIVVVLLATGFDFQAASAQAGSTSGPAIVPGAAVFTLFYVLVIGIAALWVGARLFLLHAAIVNERRGVGAFGRSFALTRGLTGKLIGVNLLFTVVLAVAAVAARSVVFILFRLLLGPAQVATATWLGGIADALMTSAFIVVVAVFAARLYVAVTGGAAPAGA